jgi:hypothetical protein
MEADPENPRLHLAWALVSIKTTDGGIMLNHPDDLERWSEHLFKAGYRFHPECQEIKRLPPRRGDEHWLNPTYQWVPIDTPDPAPIRTPDVTQYTQYEQADLLEQMVRDGKFAPEQIDDMLARGQIREDRIAPAPMLARPEPVIDVSRLKDVPRPEPKKRKRRKR